MSDKISDELIQEIATGRFVPKHSAAVLMARELLARRAAEVKPVKLPEIIQMEMGGYGGVPVVTVAELLEAIKAAGGTIEEEQN
ncbi:hypothetical protein [Rouxiella sp. WC2420]|uniref:Uncharacterized protein n=1 Tax=Rouxiella sp. WC2420 TaxID=3234145 RepID=A0AB39VMB5_9GAMM